MKPEIRNNTSLTTEEMVILIDEIRDEKGVHGFFFKDKSLEVLVNTGIEDIDSVAGTRIDYTSDLKARMLLKNYVFYAIHQRLAEFKEVYLSEYTELQIKYY